MVSNSATATQAYGEGVSRHSEVSHTAAAAAPEDHQGISKKKKKTVSLSSPVLVSRAFDARALSLLRLKLQLPSLLSSLLTQSTKVFGLLFRHRFGVPRCRLLWLRVVATHSAEACTHILFELVCGLNLAQYSPYCRTVPHHHSWSHHRLV